MISPDPVGGESEIVPASEGRGGGVGSTTRYNGTPITNPAQALLIA